MSPFNVTGPAAFCNVKLVLDYAYLRLFGGDVTAAAQYAMAIVNRANTIYEHNGPLLGGYDKSRPFVPINFQVRNITIATEQFCNSENRSDTDVKCGNDSIVAGQLLARFAQSENFTNHCMALLFTGRLLAETAGISSLGGACCSEAAYPEMGSGNVALISVPVLLSLGPDAAATTLSHELGHSLGALDEDSDFLMSRYPAQTSPKFSNQTIEEMRQLLLNNHRGRRGGARDYCLRRRWCFHNNPISPPKETTITLMLKAVVGALAAIAAVSYFL